MFAIHAQMYGHSHVGAERQHEGCPCVTVTIETAAGDKIAVAVDDAAALEALGWAILGEAERLKQGEQPAQAVAPALRLVEGGGRG